MNVNVDEAWESFIKSHQVKKASVDEKLDMIASQMNELQTDVSRLAENIPEMQGDAAAMETANAMAPMEGPGMGAEPGVDELAALLGGEEDVGAEEAMPEEAMPEEGGEEMAPVETPPGAVPPEVAPEEIPEVTPAESAPADVGAPEEVPEMAAGGANADMIARIKDLIAEETDPDKLAALSDLLAMAVGSESPAPMESMEVEDIAVEDVPEEPPAEPEGGPVKKSDDAVEDAEDAVEKKLEGAPDIEGSSNGEAKTSSTELTKSMGNALLEEIVEAIMPILAKFTGEGGEELPLDQDDDEVPVEGEAVVEIEEEGDEEKDPEDEISEETDHFEESGVGCEDGAPSEPIEKSFIDMFSEKMGRRVGVDGMFAKVPAHMRPAELRDGHRDIESVAKSAEDSPNGKHIRTYEEVISMQKSDRPDATSTVNGEIGRPDPASFAKSDSSRISFEQLMKASDPHELMQNEWNEYNIFKSQY